MANDVPYNLDLRFQNCLLFFFEVKCSSSGDRSRLEANQNVLSAFYIQLLLLHFK